MSVELCVCLMSGFGSIGDDIFFNTSSEIYHIHLKTTELMRVLAPIIIFELSLNEYTYIIYNIECIIHVEFGILVSLLEIGLINIFAVTSNYNIYYTIRY